MISHERIDRVVPVLGRLRREVEGPPQIAAQARCARGRATWDDVRVALGDALDRVVPALCRNARDIAHARSQGRPTTASGIGRCIPAILSYPPGECPPEEFSQRIEAAACEVGRDRFTAIVAMLILGTRDGIALREEIWGCAGASSRPTKVAHCSAFTTREGATP
jgi:hypothetical protein